MLFVLSVPPLIPLPVRRRRRGRAAGRLCIRRREGNVHLTVARSPQHSRSATDWEMLRIVWVGGSAGHPRLPPPASSFLILFGGAFGRCGVVFPVRSRLSIVHLAASRRSADAFTGVGDEDKNKDAARGSFKLWPICTESFPLFCVIMFPRVFPRRRRIPARGGCLLQVMGGHGRTASGTGAALYFRL
ncbi:hypothetical protein B0H13DRAFT_2310430 [Mycena leptocephala]|nr:hypothetical protein B0H13DRAFT_2310430 [Mycena leptocephala]